MYPGFSASLTSSTICSRTEVSPLATSWTRSIFRSFFCISGSWTTSATYKANNVSKSLTILHIHGMSASSRGTAGDLDWTLSYVATSVLRMSLLHVVAFSKKLLWLAQTKVISLKTQLHAVNASWKRLSQLSFRRSIELIIFVSLLTTFKVKYILRWLVHNLKSGKFWNQKLPYPSLASPNHWNTQCSFEKGLE